MAQEDFSKVRLDDLRAAWHKEREAIEAAQARQSAICLELDRRNEPLPKGPMC